MFKFYVHELINSLINTIGQIFSEKTRWSESRVRLSSSATKQLRAQAAWGPVAPEAMWKLHCSSHGDRKGPMGKHLFSLNDHVGRHIWEHASTHLSTEDIAVIEHLRENFKLNRRNRKHSSDALMRLQYEAIRDARGRTIKTSPPPRPAYDASSGTTDAPLTLGVVHQALRAGIDFYQGLQDDDGHWPSDYGGPMFLMPGLIIALYVMGKLDHVLSEPHKIEMRRYLRNHQNEDGGFGLHIEGQSTMFGTVLSYAAMRLLGMSSNASSAVDRDNSMVDALSWIRARGGAVNVPSWGKFYLCVLGVYDWKGLNPVPPECWLSPYTFNPLHPGRFWCHCRMVYLPMSYLYGTRATAQPTELTELLKQELYIDDYDCIDWDKTRNACAEEDLYYPHPWIQDLIWSGLSKVEQTLVKTSPGKWLRDNACKLAMEHIHYEDENTRYIDIGPVNKVLNMLCCWFENPEGSATLKHMSRLHDYLWLAEDGMKMQGYNGSQLWDCAFAVQAIVASGLAAEYRDCLRTANNYLDQTQVQADCPGELMKWHRHISKGAWPFSTRDHGWPISDCSSEGLKAALELESLGAALTGPPIPVISERWNWWLGNIRKYPLVSMGRDHKSCRDIRRHHDRLLVR